jgi:hypothetical protein
MIVNGEEVERVIQRREERSDGAGYQFVDNNGIRGFVDAVVSFAFPYQGVIPDIDISIIAPS